MTVAVEGLGKPHGKPLGRGGRPSHWTMRPVQLARSFSVLACLLFTWAVFSVSVACGQPGEIRNGDTAEPATEHTIAIGSERFRIPAGYIWRMYGNRDPYRSAVTLEALLPGLEPRTPHNRAEFEVLGHGRRIMIGISSIKMRAPVAQILLNYQNLGRLSVDEIKSLDNGIHSIRSLNNFRGDEWFITIQNHQITMIVQCNASGSVPSPGCRVALQYHMSISIELNFSRSYLPDLFPIYQNLHQFLDAAEERARTEAN